MNKNSKRQLLRGAAFAMAAVFATPVHTDATPPTPAVPDFTALFNDGPPIIDNIRNNLNLYARTLGQSDGKPTTGRRDLRTLLMTNSLKALQAALMDYRGSDMNPARFTPIQSDGVMGRKTALLLMEVAVELRMKDVFMRPAIDTHDGASARGLAALRAYLRTTAPEEYTAHLETLAVQFDLERQVNSNIAESATAQAFQECAASRQQVVLTAGAMQNEIARVDAEPGYVTAIAPEACMGYLSRLSLPFRRQAQLDFLHNSPVIDEENASWCNRQDKTGQFETCLEYNL